MCRFLLVGDKLNRMEMGIYSSTYLFAVKGGQLVGVKFVRDWVGLKFSFKVFFGNPTQHDTQLLGLIVL